MKSAQTGNLFPRQAMLASELPSLANLQLGKGVILWKNVQVGFSIEIIQFIVCKLGWKNQSLPILSYFQIIV